MAHPLPPLRRLVLIHRATARNRPVRIVYDGESPCEHIEGNERVIEVHDVKTTEAGDILLIAWCQQCQTIEHFRLDRIRSHRALRRRCTGPTPRFTPYFTVLRPLATHYLTKPLAAAEPTADSLLAAAVRDIAAAADPAQGAPAHAAHLIKDCGCPGCAALVIRRKARDAGLGIARRAAARVVAEAEAIVRAAAEVTA